jgi:hypothetical protein
MTKVGCVIRNLKGIISQPSVSSQPSVFSQPSDYEPLLYVNSTETVGKPRVIRSFSLA